VFRYACSVLVRLAPMVADSGAHLCVLHSLDWCDPAYLELRSRVPEVRTEFVEIPDDPGFTRTSPWLREWLVRQQVDLYYTAHYIVDVQLPVPFIHTIHDLVRLKHPRLSYTDESFRVRFGEQEFHRIQLALESLRDYVPAEQPGLPNGEIFLPYFWAVNRFQVERCSQVVTVSEMCREDIVEILGAPPNKVTVVPNAVETAFFYPRQQWETDEVRERLGVPRTHCLCAGLAHPHKRVPWLLDVWADARCRLPAEATLVVVCSDPRARGRLEELARRPDLEGRTLLLDPVSDDELACLYSAARAVVVPSMHEGFCLPAHEALACGTEALVPDLEAVRESLGESGHFYNPNSADELAHHLVAACTDRLETKAATYQTSYSWERSASRLFETVQGVWSSQ
jgi:glycosyltransferase involved in cell wall biosynthesis